MTGHNQYKSTV